MEESFCYSYSVLVYIFSPIGDASPKYVLSLDRFDYSRDGIMQINIVDFLLGKRK